MDSENNEIIKEEENLISGGEIESKEWYIYIWNYIYSKLNLFIFIRDNNNIILTIT